jgi:hypothetical protein
MVFKFKPNESHKFSQHRNQQRFAQFFEEVRGSAAEFRPTVRQIVGENSPVDPFNFGFSRPRRRTRLRISLSARQSVYAARVQKWPQPAPPGCGHPLHPL